MATYYGRKYKMLELRHRLKELLLAARIALKSKELGKPVAGGPVYVAMIDGESFHGGMCDRFKGIISLYAYCKHRGLPFRIRYTYPFRLEDYLSPAAYDWTLRPGEYTDNPLYSRVLYMRGEHLATRLLKLKTTRRQIHYYSNRDCLAHVNEALARRSEDRYGWGDLFCELFRPGTVLAGQNERPERRRGVGRPVGLGGVRGDALDKAPLEAHAALRVTLRIVRSVVLHALPGPLVVERRHPCGVSVAESLRLDASELDGCLRCASLDRDETPALLDGLPRVDPRVPRLVSVGRLGRRGLDDGL